MCPRHYWASERRSLPTCSCRSKPPRCSMEALSEPAEAPFCAAPSPGWPEELRMTITSLSPAGLPEVGSYRQVSVSVSTGKAEALRRRPGRPRRRRQPDRQPGPRRTGRAGPRRLEYRPRRRWPWEASDGSPPCSEPSEDRRRRARSSASRRLPSQIFSSKSRRSPFWRDVRARRCGLERAAAGGQRDLRAAGPSCACRRAPSE